MANKTVEVQDNSPGRKGLTSRQCDFRWFFSFSFSFSFANYFLVLVSF